jgi:hypothetical protein
MTKIALEDRPAEMIKAHILDPDNSPLPEQYQAMLTRAVSMYKLLDKHPVAKNAIKFHRILYPDISLDTAYRDLGLARQMFNNYQDFDFDFWLNWTIGDITANIIKCRDTGLSSDRKIIAMEHANLSRILGKRPDVPVDPLRNAKHEFYIMVNLDGKSAKLDMNSLHKLPRNTIEELNRILFAGNEIDEQGAVEIMNS